MKNILSYILSIFILIIIMTIAISIYRKNDTSSNNTDNGRIQIIATLFPEYDFAKQIVGDKADVKLLLSSGVESHNYEPTAKDMIEILNSNLFLYTGTDLEPWTADIVETLSQTNSKIINVAENITLIKLEEFEEKFINSEILDDEDEHHHDEEIYDEHIWMSPQNAIIMIDNILDAICEQDPENAEYYKKNA